MDNKQTNWSQKWFHPDVPKSVRGHLLGENHTRVHKLAYGVAIMFLGVTIAKGGMYFESFVLHLFADGIGYLLHAIGAIPIIKAIDTEGKL